MIIVVLDFRFKKSVLEEDVNNIEKAEKFTKKNLENPKNFHEFLGKVSCQCKQFLRRKIYFYIS